MHRKIDTFTDNHHVFKQSKNRIRGKYNHYSGVIIDLFYDHFLAKNWDEYSNIPLRSFTIDLYDIILDQEHIIPEKARYMLPFMVKSKRRKKKDKSELPPESELPPDVPDIPDLNEEK